MKQVMKAEHNGKTVAVYYNESWEYPYRICDMTGKKKVWLDERESFGEASEQAIYQLYC